MLSIVLATYNEAQNIRQCLQAVADMADEVIVVDGSSIDKTAQIAESLGARVILTTNKPNFHINKQMAMDEAKGDLILQLDADEVVDSELRACILKLHQEVMEAKRTNSLSSFQPKAWYLKRKNQFLGHFFKKSGQYPDPVIRLYINGYAKLPQKDVHEQMVVTGETGWADGHIIHYANPSFSAYLRKWHTYTSFKAQQLFDIQLSLSFKNSLYYLLWLPTFWFFKIYLRHKGFMDGVAGLVFAVMSALHHPMAYLKLWELYEQKKS